MYHSGGIGFRLYPKRSDRIFCGRCTAAEPPEECRTVMEVKDFRYGSAGVQHLEVVAV